MVEISLSGSGEGPGASKRSGLLYVGHRRGPGRGRARRDLDPVSLPPVSDELSGPLARRRAAESPTLGASEAKR
jgi:hypothetical protein